LQCTWFSIVWHAFLSELWIKHKWLSIPRHSALEVNIWWKSYLFDATKLDEIVEFSYWNKNWIYTEMIWARWFDFISWDPEKILQSHIYANLRCCKTNDKAIEMYKKTIELNPIDVFIYNKISKLFSKIWNEKLSNLYDYTSEILNWEESSITIPNNEKSQIDNFIKTENYTWLKDYLFSLEKKK